MVEREFIDHVRQVHEIQTSKREKAEEETMQAKMDTTNAKIHHVLTTLDIHDEVQVDSEHFANQTINVAKTPKEFRLMIFFMKKLPMLHPTKKSLQMKAYRCINKLLMQ